MANATKTTYAVVKTAQVTGQAIDAITFGYAGKAANAVMSVISSAPENADTQVRRAVRNGTGSQAVGQDLGLIAGAVVEFFGPKKVTQTLQLATKVLPATKLVVVSKNFEALGVEGVVAAKTGKSHLAGLDLAATVEASKKTTLIKKNPNPLTIRQGQEWKLKIHGNAQNTGTPGHSLESAKEGIKFAKNPLVDDVYFDNGYHKALKKMGYDDIRLHQNRRPDVIATVNKEKLIFATEIQSKTDRERILVSRNLKVAEQLEPHGITVEVNVKKIPSWDYEKGAAKK